MTTTSSFNAGGLLSVDGDDDNHAGATSHDAAGTILVNGGAVSVESCAPTVANINLLQEFGLGGSGALSLDETNGAVLATSLLARKQCAVVMSLLSDNDAVDTVAWLLRWYPDQARAFALAMHELAAWQYDDSLTEHWHHVLELMPRNSNTAVSGRLRNIPQWLGPDLTRGATNIC